MMTGYISGDKPIDFWSGRLPDGRPSAVRREKQIKFLNGLGYYGRQEFYKKPLVERLAILDSL